MTESHTHTHTHTNTHTLHISITRNLILPRSSHMPRQQSQLLVMQLVPCIARTEELLHLLDLAHLSPQLNPPDVELILGPCLGWSESGTFQSGLYSSIFLVFSLSLQGLPSLSCTSSMAPFLWDCCIYLPHVFTLLPPGRSSLSITIIAPWSSPQQLPHFPPPVESLPKLYLIKPKSESQQNDRES